MASGFACCHRCPRQHGPSLLGQSAVLASCLLNRQRSSITSLLQQVLVNHLVHWLLQITFRKAENLKLHLHYNLSQSLSHLSHLPLYLDPPLPSKLLTVSSYYHRLMVSLVTRVGKKYIMPWTLQLSNSSALLGFHLLLLILMCGKNCLKFLHQAMSQHHAPALWMITSCQSKNMSVSFKLNT